MSATPIRRLEALSHWSPVELEIVCTVPDPGGLERRLHCCFADLHLHHEWFHPGARLIDAVDRIARGTPVSEAVNLDDTRGVIRSGANMSPLARKHRSLRLRLSWAERKIRNHFRAQSGQRYDLPADVRAIVDAASRYDRASDRNINSPISQTDQQRIDTVLSDPIAHAVPRETAA